MEGEVRGRENPGKITLKSGHCVYFQTCICCCGQRMMASIDYLCLHQDIPEHVLQNEMKMVITFIPRSPDSIVVRALAYNGSGQCTCGQCTCSKWKWSVHLVTMKIGSTLDYNESGQWICYQWKRSVHLLTVKVVSALASSESGQGSIPKSGRM